MQGIFQKENTDKALKYGIYRHLPTYEKIIRNLVSFYTKNYKKTPFSKYVNPENKELVNSLAPAWLVTSHNDHLRKYTINFEKALAAAQKEHELIDYPKNKNLTHAFSVFEPFLDESSEVIDMMTAYLRKF